MWLRPCCVLALQDKSAGLKTTCSHRRGLVDRSRAKAVSSTSYGSVFGRFVPILAPESVDTRWREHQEVTNVVMSLSGCVLASRDKSSGLNIPC